MEETGLECFADPARTENFRNWSKFGRKLTEQFANVYTFESPGGWNIIGKTPQIIFDSTKEKNPNLINPGDVVTFEQITKDQYYNKNE